MHGESDESRWWLTLVGCGIVVMYVTLLYSASHPTDSNELGRPIAHFGTASLR
jgi:hypothetical protein